MPSPKKRDNIENMKNKILFVREFQGIDVIPQGIHYFYVVYKSGTHRLYYRDTIPKYIIEYMHECRSCFSCESVRGKEAIITTYNLEDRGY